MDIPLNPPGWNPKRWAAFCRHMAEVSRRVRPDLSDQWARVADAIEGKRPPEPVGLEALLLASPTGS